MEENDHLSLFAELKWSLLAAVILVVGDAFFLGQGVLGALAAVLMMFVMVPAAYMAHRAEDRDTVKVRMLRAGIFLCAGIAVFAVNAANNRLADGRAKEIASACERFQAENGAYPERLKDLVPRYLSKVPRAKLTFLYNDFRYMNLEGRPSLSWVVFPPEGRRFHPFELSAEYKPAEDAPKRVGN